MKTLITGFDAFGGNEINPSELVVGALAALELDDIVTAILPTSYRHAEDRIVELIRLHRPERVLMLGLASSAAAIRLETQATNLDDSDAADNDGEVRRERRIAEAAPARFECSLPLHRMADIARRQGIDTRISDDAGGFVCNHVYFTAARVLADELPESRCGFVHLPSIDATGDDLSRLVGLITAWVGDSAI